MKPTQKIKLNTGTFNDWKEKKNIVEILTLKSGMTIEIKKLNILECVSVGTIPFELFSSTLEMKEDNSIQDVKNIKDMTELMYRIAIIAVVNPALNKNNVKEVPFDDIQEIFNYVSNLGGASELKNFRKE